MTLTIDEVREEPAALLNAKGGAVRQFAEEALGLPEGEAEKLVAVVEAFRGAFVARLEGRLGHDHLGRLQGAYRAIAPPLDHRFGSDTYEVQFEPERGSAWEALRDRFGRDVESARNPLVVFRLAWDHRHGEEIGACEECGLLFLKSKFARERRFCSDACRKRAARK